MAEISKINRQGVEYDIKDAVARADITTLSTTKADKTEVEAVEQDVTNLIAAVGTPLTASTAAAMTDHDKIYVYTGSETGYTYGNWYYWDGSAWTSGGIYNSEGVPEPDDTLSIQGKAADAKATGDAVGDLKSAVNVLHNNIAKNATVGEGIYINPNSDKSSATTGGLSVLVIPAEPNAEYYVWKNTPTVMRLAVGSIQTPANNDIVTRRVMHSVASTDPLTIETSDTDLYLYIQLYTYSDSEQYQNNAVNTNSLIVYKVDHAADLLREDMEEFEAETNVKFGAVAREYDETIAYKTGQFVFKDGNLYQRKSVAGTPQAEEWTSGHWTSIATLGEAVAESLPLSYFAPYYDGTQTYSKGDYVLYNGYIRRAKSDISTPETFTSGHWETRGTNIFRSINDLSEEISDVEAAVPIGIFRFPVPSVKTSIGLLQQTPSSNNTGMKTNIIPIYAPIRVKLDDPSLMVRINSYTSSLTFSGTYKETIREYEDNCDQLITSDNYPLYIAIGIQKNPVSEISESDLATITGELHVLSCEETPYADVSMFQTIGVGGDSWTAGAVHSEDGSYAIARIGQGWAENMARQHGIQCLNWAIGGTSVRTWFNSDTDDKGLKGLLAANAVGLYILSFGGSNDWQSGADGARGWEIGEDVPGSSTYYIGTITDINGNDYAQYPKTFYGYYGRIVKMIQDHAPSSKIIITTPNTYPTTNAKCTALYAATEEIAEHYGLPYLDLRRCDYFGNWKNTSILNDQHPTAAMYSGMGKSVGKLIPTIIAENSEYFRDYNGELSTVSVEWSAVTK